ncbi:MAG: hypothetical protein M3N42_11135 [Cyanobacteriota bacterium]|nr:hypothetical protein [Cyanobacteriota bacterium]
MPNRVGILKQKFSQSVGLPFAGCGFPIAKIVVMFSLVTTLLNPKVYTKAKLAQLYQLRWEAEVDLRHVKTTLGREMLRGKTPSQCHLY